MQIRISKTLRRHLDVGSLEAQRTGSVPLAADIAFLSLVKEGMSHATHILRKLLKDWEIYQIKIRIEREAAKAAAENKGKASKEEINSALSDMISGLTGTCLGTSVFRRKPTVSAGQLPVVNSGHLLLWILSNKGLITSRVLEMYGITTDKVDEYLSQMPPDEDYYVDIEILDRMSKQSMSKYTADNNQEDDMDDEEDNGTSSSGATAVKSRAKTKSTLDQFGVNLAVSVAKGDIDPVIGREKEIERLIQILGRRKKNNPILIGEAGVGKSAIVEGLALRIASGDVPHTLVNKEIFSLDIASLVAGTKYRGEFEQRMKTLLSELRKNRDIILFIDEVHTIAGAGSTQGSLDTANILKPALARGELQCIGATTLDEYRENIESDSALERRFQKIIVEPTSKEETLLILHNIKTHYEMHHGVVYTDESLKACVDLTERYVTDRNFPDKAIDVLDESGSKARLYGTQVPTVLKELETALIMAEQEKAKAVSSLSYDQASEARLRVLALREKIAETKAQWKHDQQLNPFVIGTEHIEQVITSMTGIPVERVSKDERKRLGNMEQHLSGNVIGQHAAVRKVTKSIQRSRTGLKDPNKPIGVFMFVGPTGVGKTHLAKELAKWMFDKPDALIRVDMSEYSEKHNVSRMIGSPPGYVGYNEGGQLTEAVRRQPYAVVLFDEVEKAHPDVFNLMLQIFDEGQLTDGNGRKVDFRNTVIILTSNVGSRQVASRPNAVGYLTNNKEQIKIVNKECDYRQSLERTFAPEFINRIDDIVIFNTLTSSDVQRIVELELKGLDHRAQALGYKLNVTPKAKKKLAELGYEERYGVRSLKRTILDVVEEPLAQLIVSGDIYPGDTIRIECRNDSVEVLKQPEKLRKTS